MSAATDRINALLPRILPVVVGVIIVSFGYYWVLEPGIADVLKTRVEVRTLEARAHVLEERTARGRGVAPPDLAQALSLFEQRVSKEDRVADVGERLIRAVAESATDGKLRNLVMGTGDQPAAAPAGQVRQAAAGDVETVDPRWRLFPYRLTHTPVTLSFDASYGTIARFFSKIRDLPTGVEIRSVKLTRGLPLMSAQVTVFVFRRGDMVADAGAAGLRQPAPGAPQPPEPAGPPANPLVPRIVEPRGPGEPDTP